jgi:hypothetical protein
VPIGAVDVSDRRPVCLAIGAVDASRCDPLLHVGVLWNAGAALWRDLQKSHFTPPLVLRLDKALERQKPMRDTVRVIQAIYPMISARPTRLLSMCLTIGNRSECWARRAKASVSMPTGKTSIRIVRSATVKLKSWLCKPHSRARYRLKLSGLEADEVVFAGRRNETLVVGQRSDFCESSISPINSISGSERSGLWSGSTKVDSGKRESVRTPADRYDRYVYLMGAM